MKVTSNKIILFLFFSVIIFYPSYGKYVCSKQHFKALTNTEMQRLKKQKVNKDQVFHRANDAEPQTLDPGGLSTVNDSNIIIDLFEPLFQLNAKGKSILGAAKSWKVERKGHGRYVYTFCLRKNHWSNGQPVKASDFVFAFRRLVDPKSGLPNGYLIDPFVNATAIIAGKAKASTLGVRAIGDNVLEIITDGKVPYIKELLAMPALSPVYPPVVKKYKNRWTRPEYMVTNGAFHLAVWIPNEREVAIKSMTYWDQRHVKLYKIIYYPNNEASAIENSYITGVYDFVDQSGIPISYLLYIKRHKDLKEQYHQFPLIGTYFYVVNVHKDPVNNLNLRKALYLAFIHKELIGDVLHNALLPSYSLVPPGTSNYYSGKRKPTMRLKMNVASTCGVSGLKNHKGYVWVRDLTPKQSNALAKCYYKKAGYTPTHKPKLNLYYNTLRSNKTIALVLTSMWHQTLGVNVPLLNEEWKVFVSQLNQIDTQRSKSPIKIARTSWIGDFDDPVDFLSLFVAHSGQNSAGYENLKYNKLIKSSFKITSLRKRTQILAKAEQMFLDDYAIYPLYTYTSRWLVKPYIKGFPKKVGILGYIPSKYMSIDVQARRKALHGK